MQAALHATPATALFTGATSYRVRLAQGPADLKAAQRLRFLVFNVELNEGLERSWAALADADEFDAVCDHLMLEDARTGELVGTYRLQDGRRAAAHLGYYSEREFDFSPYEPLRDGMLELGRACIAPEHRQYAALSTLWKGIAQYAGHRRLRYLIGCSSLTSQDEAGGAAAWRALAGHAAPPHLLTTPREAFACASGSGPTPAPKVPKLLAAYLALGAVLCGPPAIDREFRTIDFLTLLDLQPESRLARQRLARFGVVPRG